MKLHIYKIIQATLNMVVNSLLGITGSYSS
jgi:hypothetical protein